MTRGVAGVSPAKPDPGQPERVPKGHRQSLFVRVLLGSHWAGAWHNALDTTRTVAHPLDVLKSHPVSTCQVSENHPTDLKDGSLR
jgi:hypothetical protein